ncbi:integrase [Syntrophotalea acetylenivorans]|uniref:Integrase n=1 Tax=Syntrophotalea acetylenivorans TaxID=1842532 RepID=A0A1L3GM73_9BACT|nr:recombinase family protein [Syntrophotalea acetylenivorans]APG27029.1 integrase [Syntrophotalea acetylenivorans]
MSIIGYARVSTADQSLDIQLEQLQAAGVNKVFQEKISGVKRDRPQLAAMLNYMREGDTLIITKLDRIARSTKHLLEIVDLLEERGVSFKVLNINLDTSTPTGKLMLTMLGAIATFEREMLLERQAEGIRKAKQEGKYQGRKPTARAKAPQVIELARSGMTKQKIAEQLDIGIASVYRILKNKN